MEFELNIESDNAGMTEDTDVAVADILEDVALRVREGFTSGRALDVNGNLVGSWKLVTGSL